MATEVIEEKTFCANHPDRETSLRCNRCGKYICVKCARRMATGYRCPECVNQQQQTFETAAWYDHLIAGVIAAVLTFLGGLIVPRLGWFVIFLAPMAGGIIAEVIFRVLKGRRSKYLPWAAVGGVVLSGAVLCVLPVLIFVFSLLNPQGGWSLTTLISLGWTVGYIALCASTLYYRLRGIRIG
jgi:predicted RNA-binding Zn-ribbon protein involved in translation (DUF1610 family)